MSLSDLDKRLLDFVPRSSRSEDPATATAIWRRFAGLTDGRVSMTTRMRKQRRETAARLEDLAYDGYITVVEGERHGVSVPTYWRGPKQDPDTDWANYADEGGYG